MSLDENIDTGSEVEMARDLLVCLVYFFGKSNVRNDDSGCVHLLIEIDETTRPCSHHLDRSRLKLYTMLVCCKQSL